MEIELRHLRYFIAVAEERHFGRAAKGLHIAQPPLSRQIAQLEAELGAELFDRATRPVRLTAAGVAFLEEARSIVNHSRRALERGRRSARGEQSRLSVAALPWSHNGILPSVAGTFCSRFPDARLDISTRGPPEQADAILKRLVDVGLTRPTAEHRELRIEPLLEERMAVVLPERHPLARRSELSFEQLATEPLVSIPEDLAPSFVSRQTNEFARRGLTPSIVHQAPDAHAQIALVAAGVGLALHLTPAPDLPRDGVVVVPLADDEVPTFPLVLAWRRDDRRELVGAFLDSARTIARSRAATP